MDSSGASSTPPSPRSAPGSSARPIRGSSQPSRQPPAPSPELADRFADWKAVSEQRDFYDERDCLDTSYNLVFCKPGERTEDDVVIFDYSLDPDCLNHADGNTPVEEGSPSSGHFSADGDIFFQMPKNEFIESRQFGQIINPIKEPLPIRSRGPRLGIIDFAQCYDTHDDNLLNLMGEKLGLERDGETDFRGTYLQRVPTLPGHGRFRTGISLRAPLKRPTEASGHGSSGDRFVLFVSFPYFGRSNEEFILSPENESVTLLDFKSLGAHSSDPEGEGGDIRKILVHQARYMIFDNYTMATFRSKEDSTKDRVPLHPFQERIGAFRAIVHMIANHADSELWALEKLQVSLCKLEEAIDQTISDAEINEDDQGIKEKQKRVRDLLTSLNTLSASFFATISVAKRQIAILQDLHSLFLTSYRTKTKDYEKGYQLRRNPFHRKAAPIPILSEHPEQICPDTLDTIDEVVREKKSFIEEVKELVQNMDIRRKILSAFLKSDQAKSAPTEKTAQETTSADIVTKTQGVIEQTQAELVQQGRTLTSFTIVTTAFLPLSFCTSFYGMQTVREFGGKSAQLSLGKFWKPTGPIFGVVLLVTLLFIAWKRPWAISFRSRVWGERSKPEDIESGGSSTPGPRALSQADTWAPPLGLPWLPVNQPPPPSGLPMPPSGLFRPLPYLIPWPPSG
ncbi:hypothetical protein B9Z19DRAFT_965998 [Tuber borchii]|uniref:Cora-like Mg2+ transporter protein-domain-containing protein n=1 Tax=Tuber borchii TaxID=42251 RepID=A0A2T7A5K0_TUBBO|nr:hypothetical protein B9Z19DRAFT_965998 [Tuber borchii]